MTESTCRVCAHPAVAELDAALTGGVSARELSRQGYDLSRHSLDRHRANGHMSVALAPVTPGSTDGGEGGAAALDLDRLERFLASWLATAEREGREPNTATVNMLKEARFLAQAQRDAHPRAVVTVDWHTDASWLHARAALTEALAPHPEARAAVADALATLEDASGEER